MGSRVVKELRFANGLSCGGVGACGISLSAVCKVWGSVCANAGRWRDPSVYNRGEDVRSAEICKWSSSCRRVLSVLMRDKVVEVPKGLLIGSRL